MKPRYSLVAVAVIAAAIVLLLLNSVHADSPQGSPTVASSSGTALEQVENENVGGLDATKTSQAASPAAQQAAGSSTAPEGNGAILLQTYCAHCHSVKLLEHTRKSRAEWEKTLARMERHSGLSSEAEKLIVLDYLAASDKR
jgi:cytochrome c5